MLNQKEEWFKQFYEVTLEATESKDPDQIAACMDEREKLIGKIDEYDQLAGRVLMNDAIQAYIQDIQRLDQVLLPHMEVQKQETMEKIRSLKNGRLLKNQYSPHYQVSDGLFYDKRK